MSESSESPVVLRMAGITKQFPGVKALDSVDLCVAEGDVAALFTASVWPSSHGRFVELYAIAGAVLGGCALKGGEGTIGGILIGTAILVLLGNVVNMLDQPSSLRDVFTGGVLFVGVLLNQLGLRGIKRMLGISTKQAG